MKFVSLHHHSTFSYMDGYGTPAQHVERLAELGYSAACLTEHGNVSSHVQLEKAATKAGLRPIFGLEAYTHPTPTDSRRKFHLTLLAADNEGYGNLMRVVSRSWAEGFYQWPTVGGAMLSDHADGLIALSGCSDSLLACSLLGGKDIDPADASVDRAMRVASSFKEVFGDRYYLECQMFPELERTKTINQAYERMGRLLGIPLVATADVHYPYPDDNEMQVILHAAGRGSGNVAAQAESWEYDIRLCPPEDDSRVMDRLRGTGLSKKAALQALESTATIASRCDVKLRKASRLRYPLDRGQTAEELIWELLREGWRYRVAQGNRNLIERAEECAARVKYEMERIAGKDFIDYHLVVSDLVRYAKDNGIAVGPARGSCAASEVCYLLRITEVDPMDYPLMFFERYIDPNREDEPDIDLDFDDERRGEVQAYAGRKYGADCVGLIGTYTKYKGKNSLDDVARVHRIPKSPVETVKGMIVERSGGDSRADFALQDTIDMFPAVAEVFRAYPDLAKAVRLEGNYRGMSTHAAGLVITNEPIANVCAQYTREDSKKQKHTAVSVDKKDAAYLGLLKVDLLGLSTMGMLRRALAYADLTLEDLYRVPMDEPATIEAFRRNDVIGIFQFEGRATRVVNHRVKPDRFAEIADIGSLSRPGPLFSGTTTEYVQVKWGEKEPTRFHPWIDELTRDTKGQIIYQEQVLLTLDHIGGLPVARVHEIRKIISQKLGEAQFNASANDFVAGAKRLHGIDETTARAIWGRLVTSATYAFNVAHAVSYGMLAFWCMWMKVHHPIAFYTAQLQKTDPDKWTRLIQDAHRHDVKVQGVKPSVSGREWTPAGRRTIVAGWEQLKGIGEVTAGRIMEHISSGGQIETVDDLLAVHGIGPKTVAQLRSAIGSKDPFGLRAVARTLKSMRKMIDSRALPVPRPTHRSDDIIDLGVNAPVIWIGLVGVKDYKDFIEDERARTGETYEEIRKRIRNPHLTTGCFMHCYDDGDEDVYVRAHRTAFPKWRKAIEDITLNHDIIVVDGRKGRGVFGANLYIQRLWVIDPDD